MTPNPIEVGNRIRDIRKNKLGLSMDDFGYAIDGKAKSGTVSNWETGKNLPNNERLKRIAELAEISIDELLYGNSNVVINKIFDEILNENNYTEKELEKINLNRKKIIEENFDFFDLLASIGLEKDIKRDIKSQIKLLLFTNFYDDENINKKLINKVSFEIDLIKDNVNSLVVKRYEVDKENFQKDYMNGSYYPATLKPVIHESVNRKMYEKIESVLQNSYDEINNIYEEYFEEDFLESKWLKMRNSVLDSLSDNHFRKYSYYINNLMVLKERERNFIDQVLKSMIPDLEKNKHDLKSNEFQEKLTNFLDQVDVPKNWEVPTENIN